MNEKLYELLLKYVPPLSNEQVNEIVEQAEKIVRAQVTAEQLEEIQAE